MILTTATTVPLKKREKTSAWIDEKLLFRRIFSDILWTVGFQPLKATKS
jgi:hypothetical protein